MFVQWNGHFNIFQKFSVTAFFNVNELFFTSEMRNKNGNELFCDVDTSWCWLEACLQWSRVVVIVLRLKAVEEMYLSLIGTQTHVSHISGSNGPVSECPPA
jgi:hypothetical protein